MCEAVDAILIYLKKSKKTCPCSLEQPSEDPIRPNSAVSSVSEDELARDSVRQEANLTLTQDVLTTTQDSVMPDEVVINTNESTYQWSQPTFDQVIGRWYKVATPTWLYSSTQDSAVLALDVSKTLFNITTLFDRVKRYRYWRGGIRLRLQVNSTPFHYGSLFCAIVPNYTTGEAVVAPILNTTWSLSGQKCSGYLSANTGKPLELSCPFQMPNEYLDITQQDDTRPFYLMVCVMNPLRVAGGATSPSLQLSVFAQFTDFQLLGPSEITANSSSKKVSKADAEQKNANKQGTLGKVAGAVKDVASSLSAIPVIGGVASAVAPIASAVGSIFDYFGWDKPTNISSQVFSIERTSRGMAHGSGQDPAEPVGLKPDQKLSTETRHFGVDDKTTRSFLDLIQTPMWCGSFTIANSQATETVFKRLFIRPYAPDYDVVGSTETQRHDYLSWYSHFFKACRGGYRYFLHFDTSSYTTSRVRVTFEPSNSTVATVTDGGDSFSRIIDVNGATSVLMEVPYCYPSARMPIAKSVSQSTPSNGQLLFSLVNPVQTNGSSSDVIFVNVFRCAADDFRFYQPHKMIPTAMSGSLALVKKGNPRMLANSLIEQLGTDTCTCLGDGPKVVMDRITEDEEILSHNDFLHRYHQVLNASGLIAPLYPTAGDPYYWLSSFRAYRGAVRIITPSAFNPEGLSIDGVTTSSEADQEKILCAGAYFGLATSDLPIEIPYNNNVRFLPLKMAEDNYLDAYRRDFYSSGAAGGRCFWAAGDDFTVGLRRSPQALAIAI